MPCQISRAALWCPSLQDALLCLSYQIFPPAPRLSEFRVRGDILCLVSYPEHTQGHGWNPLGQVSPVSQVGGCCRQAGRWFTGEDCPPGQGSNKALTMDSLVRGLVTEEQCSVGLCSGQAFAGGSRHGIQQKGAACRLCSSQRTWGVTREAWAGREAWTWH